MSAATALIRFRQKLDNSRVSDNKTEELEVKLFKFKLEQNLNLLCFKYIIE